MRRSCGTPALRSIMPFCTSMAQRTASTTLRNSTSAPSPVRLITRPLCTAMVGSIRSLRSARNLAKVRSSSALASRLYPTTSAARIAASLRFSLIGPSPRLHDSRKTRGKRKLSILLKATWLKSILAIIRRQRSRRAYLGNDYSITLSDIRHCHADTRACRVGRPARLSITSEVIITSYSVDGRTI